jgi:hypothetical protein
MSLVEAEDGPHAEPPPRPAKPLEHRRVSVSLLFTISVLVGVVVSVYALFPVRHNVLMTQALAAHRDAPSWDLTAPSAGELRAWATGAVGKDAPLPRADVAVVGARVVEIFDRPAALIRLRVGGDEVTYLIQHARGIAPDHEERAEGELRAVGWRHGAWTCIGVGPAASAAGWLAAIGG